MELPNVSSLNLNELNDDRDGNSNICNNSNPSMSTNLCTSSSTNPCTSSNTNPCTSSSTNPCTSSNTNPSTSTNTTISTNPSTSTNTTISIYPSTSMSTSTSISTSTSTNLITSNQPESIKPLCEASSSSGSCTISNSNASHTTNPSNISKADPNVSNDDIIECFYIDNGCDEYVNSNLDWVNSFIHTCLVSAAIKYSDKLDKLMEEFLVHVRREQDYCTRSPRRAFFISKFIRKIFIFFYYTYNDIKDYSMNSKYTEIMVELIYLYTRMEMHATKRVPRGENDLTVSTRITNLMWIMLDHDEMTILDVLLKVGNSNSMFSRRYREMLVPMFRKILTYSHPRKFTDEENYIRVVLAFKTWRKIVYSYERNYLTECALSKIIKPPTFPKNYHLYPFLPILPIGNVDCHEHFVTTNIDLSIVCEKFFKYLKKKQKGQDVCASSTIFNKYNFLSTFCKAFDDTTEDEDFWEAPLLESIKQKTETLDDDEISVPKSTQSSSEVITISDEDDAEVVDLTIDDEEEECTPVWAECAINAAEKEKIDIPPENIPVVHSPRRFIEINEDVSDEIDIHETNEVSEDIFIEPVCSFDQLNTLKSLNKPLSTVANVLINEMMESVILTDETNKQDNVHKSINVQETKNVHETEDSYDTENIQVNVHKIDHETENVQEIDHETENIQETDHETENIQETKTVSVSKESHNYEIFTPHESNFSQSSSDVESPPFESLSNDILCNNEESNNSKTEKINCFNKILQEVSDNKELESSELVSNNTNIEELNVNDQHNNDGTSIPKISAIQGSVSDWTCDGTIEENMSRSMLNEHNEDDLLSSDVSMTCDDFNDKVGDRASKFSDMSEEALLRDDIEIGEEGIDGIPVEHAENINQLIENDILSISSAKNINQIIETDVSSSSKTQNATQVIKNDILCTNKAQKITQLVENDIPLTSTVQLSDADKQMEKENMKSTIKDIVKDITDEFSALDTSDEIENSKDRNQLPKPDIEIAEVLNDIKVKGVEDINLGVSITPVDDDQININTYLPTPTNEEINNTSSTFTGLNQLVETKSPESVQSVSSSSTDSSICTEPSTSKGSSMSMGTVDSVPEIIETYSINTCSCRRRNVSNKREELDTLGTPERDFFTRIRSEFNIDEYRQEVSEILQKASNDLKISSRFIHHEDNSSESKDDEESKDAKEEENKSLLEVKRTSSVKQYGKKSLESTLTKELKEEMKEPKNVRVRRNSIKSKSKKDSTINEQKYPKERTTEIESPSIAVLRTSRASYHSIINKKENDKSKRGIQNIEEETVNLKNTNKIEPLKSLLKASNKSIYKNKHVHFGEHLDNHDKSSISKEISKSNFSKEINLPSTSKDINKPSTCKDFSKPSTSKIYKPEINTDEIKIGKCLDIKNKQNTKCLKIEEDSSAAEKNKCISKVFKNKASKEHHNDEINDNKDVKGSDSDSDYEVNAYLPRKSYSEDLKKRSISTYDTTESDSESDRSEEIIDNRRKRKNSSSKKDYNKTEDILQKYKKSNKITGDDIETKESNITSRRGRKRKKIEISDDELKDKNKKSIDGKKYHYKQDIDVLHSEISKKIKSKFETVEKTEDEYFSDENTTKLKHKQDNSENKKSRHKVSHSKVIVKKVDKRPRKSDEEDNDNDASDDASFNFRVSEENNSKNRFGKNRLGTSSLAGEPSSIISPTDEVVLNDQIINQVDNSHEKISKLSDDCDIINNAEKQKKINETYDISDKSKLALCKDFSIKLIKDDALINAVCGYKLKINEAIPQINELDRNDDISNFNIDNNDLMTKNLSDKFELPGISNTKHNDRQFNINSDIVNRENCDNLNNINVKYLETNMKQNEQLSGMHEEYITIVQPSVSTVPNSIFEKFVEQKSNFNDSNESAQLIPSEINTQIAVNKDTTVEGNTGRNKENEESIINQRIEDINSSSSCSSNSTFTKTVSDDVETCVNSARKPQKRVYKKNVKNRKNKPNLTLGEKYLMRKFKFSYEELKLFDIEIVAKKSKVPNECRNVKPLSTRHNLTQPAKELDSQPSMNINFLSNNNNYSSESNNTSISETDPSKLYGSLTCPLSQNLIQAAKKTGGRSLIIERQDYSKNLNSQSQTLRARIETRPTPVRSGENDSESYYITSSSPELNRESSQLNQLDFINPEPSNEGGGQKQSTTKEVPKKRKKGWPNTRKKKEDLQISYPPATMISIAELEDFPVLENIKPTRFCNAELKEITSLSHTIPKSLPHTSASCSTRVPKQPSIPACSSSQQSLVTPKLESNYHNEIICENPDENILSTVNPVVSTTQNINSLPYDSLEDTDTRNYESSPCTSPEPETHLPIKKRSLSSINENIEDNKNASMIEKKSYPPTPMISIAELNNIPVLENIKPSRFRTPAELKEMPPLPCTVPETLSHKYTLRSSQVPIQSPSHKSLLQASRESTKRKPSLLQSQPLNINHTYNNPTINYHFGSAPFNFMYNTPIITPYVCSMLIPSAYTTTSTTSTSTTTSTSNTSISTNS